jgi:hypothetical protein
MHQTFNSKLRKFMRLPHKPAMGTAFAVLHMGLAWIKPVISKGLLYILTINGECYE